MKKKLACILIACMLVLGICGTACAEDMVSIQTADDFIQFLNTVSANPSVQAQLTADIDMEGKTIRPAAFFNGILDGNGHTLHNLIVETDGGSGTLFAEIGAEGTVQNLTVGGIFTGSKAACLADINCGTVVNVTSIAEVYATVNASGIVCENNGSMIGCANKGYVAAINGGMMAGIACINRGNVAECTNYSALDGALGTPAAECMGGICANAEPGSTLTDCVNLGRITVGSRGAGLVGQAVNAQLSGLHNFGDVYSTRTNIAGIAAIVEGGTIENCSNYGEVVCNLNYGAGIAAQGSAEIIGCMNHGPVQGTDYVAGIAAAWSGTISGCLNDAPVSGYSNAAGICAQFSGEMADCENRGEIIGESHRIAGVAAEMESGSIIRCSNSAHIAGGENHWGDAVGAAGILAVANGEVLLEDVCNTGLVESTTDSCGAIADQIRGNIKNAVNSSQSVKTIGSPEHAVIQNVYGIYNDGTAATAMEDFYTGELAWNLNTDNGRTANRGVWSQDGESPVLASEDHLPTKKIRCSYANGEAVLYTAGDGKLQMQPGFMLYDIVCTDEYNQTIPSDDLFRKDSLFEVESIARVRNAWELDSALSNSSIAEVVLLNSVEMDRSISFYTDKVINGRGYRLNMGEFSFETSGNVTVSNLSLRCNSQPVLISGGTLKVDGFLEVTTPVELWGGVLDLSAGMLCNKTEVDQVPSIRVQSFNTGVIYDGYTMLNDAYYANPPRMLKAAKTIVATAKQNKSLAYDIYPEIRDGVVTFFLPCNADPSKITVCTMNDAGEIVDTYKSLDMTEGNTNTIRLYGISYPVRAMQSSLPTLSFDINESYGTIEAMNSSPDHSVYCYGNVRLDVTSQLQKQNKWFSFISTEKDPERSGTMRIRGRGNSTWTTHLDVKKPYQFQLEQKVDVLGMGKHKTWILLMNDEYLVRNKLGLDLAHDLGLAYTSMGEFVDVFMNGRYLGNYLLCERVEISKERVNIAKLDDEYEAKGNSTAGLDLTGGYLMEIDRWNSEDLQVRYEPTKTAITIKEPENLDTVVNDYNAYSYINAYMLDFMDAVHGDGVMDDGRSYLEHIDIESFVRYYFHQEFLMNGDCGRGSTYMYKNRDSIDPLLYAGPVWDHDRIYENWESEGWYLPTVYRERGTITLYNQLSRRADFAQKLVEYYETSDIAQVLANASSHIADYIELLQDSAKMNRARWNLPEFDPSWLAAMMDSRADWIANNYKTLLDIPE